MKRLGALFVCALLAWPAAADAMRVESNAHHFQLTPPPEWVVDLDLPVARAANGTHLHYLLSDRQIRVAAAAQTTAYQRGAMQPVAEGGLEEAAQLEMRFSPEYQELHLHHVAVWRDGRRIDQLQPERVRLIQRETDIERRIYDGVVSALVILDDVRVGDIVDYAYSIKGTNPVFGDKFMAAVSLGWGVPVERVHVRLLSPADRPLHSRVYNTRLEPRVREAAGLREQVWNIDYAPAVSDEGDTPRWYRPYPWLQVSEYRNWAEVNAWAEPLYRYHGDLAPELKAEARRWLRGRDKLEAAALALQFVQREIRYFGVELGQNSHRPSHPNEVLQRRYGDCKDKTMLLVGLLRELGIEAHPALVSTDHAQGIADWLPSPGVFDHVIVMADIAGQRYWLDGTRSHQTGRLPALGFPNYGKALPVRPAGAAQLVDITPGDAAVSTVSVDEHFAVEDYHRPVRFTVRTRYTGGRAEAQRRSFASAARADIGRQFLNYYARTYPGIEQVHEPEVQDDQENNVLTVVESYLIEGFWEEGDGRLYFDLSGDTLGSYVGLPRTINRKTPLAVRHPVRIRHTTVLEYPEDIAFDLGAAAARTIEDEAIHYRRSVAFENRRLTVRHDYRSNGDAVMPLVLPQHMANLRRINASLRYSGWVDAPVEVKQAESAPDSGPAVPAHSASRGLIQELLQRLQ